MTGQHKVDDMGRSQRLLCLLDYIVGHRGYRLASAGFSGRTDLPWGSLLEEGQKSMMGSGGPLVPAVIL